MLCSHKLRVSEREEKKCQIQFLIGRNTWSLLTLHNLNKEIKTAEFPPTPLLLNTVDIMIVLHKKSFALHRFKIHIKHMDGNLPVDHPEKDNYKTRARARAATANGRVRVNHTLLMKPLEIW